MAGTIATTSIGNPNVAQHGQFGRPEASIIRNAASTNGAAAQVSTLTVGTYTASAVYSFELGGAALSYTESSDSDADGVATKLAAAINNSPRHRNQVTATVSTSVVTITAKRRGLAFEIATDDSKLAVATTTDAALAGDIAAGLGVLRDTAPGGNDHRPAVKLADVSGLTAQSYDIVYGANTAIVAVTFEGETKRAEGASAALLATAIDGLFTGVSAVNDSGTITISADTALDSFELGALENVTLDAVTEGDRFVDQFAGITGHTGLNTTTAGYIEGRGPDVLEGGNGGVWVLFETAPSVGSKVYLATASSERSKLKLSRATGRVWASSLRVREVRGNYGHVFVN